MMKEKKTWSKPSLVILGNGSIESGGTVTSVNERTVMARPQITMGGRPGYQMAPNWIIFQDTLKSLAS